MTLVEFDRRFDGSCRDGLPDPNTLRFLEPFEFLDAYERYISVNETYYNSATKQILNLERYTTGKARQWYTLAARTLSTLTWAQFRALFLKTFGPNDLDGTIEEVLPHLRQGEQESVFLFNTRFATLQNYMSEERRRQLYRGGLKYFLNGLTTHRNLQLQVRLRAPTTLEAAMDIATELSETLDTVEASSHVPESGPITNAPPNATNAQETNILQLERLIDEDTSGARSSEIDNLVT
ncbi:hypothetical protein HK405_008430, partial [Cladochytrium tenue]